MTEPNDPTQAASARPSQSTPVPAPPVDGATPGSLPADEERAKRYARTTFRLGLVGMALDPVALIVFLITGGSLALRCTWSGHWTHASAVVAGYIVTVVVAMKLLELPLDLLGRRIEIRYGMNRQSLSGWWGDKLKAFGLELLLGLPLVEGLYLLLRRAPAHWWLWAWGLFVLLAVVLAQLAPVLLLPIFYKFRKLDPDSPEEAALTERLQHRSAQAGTRVRGVFEWKLGEKTAKANAALTGWGPTRRVIISDTLLTGSPAEEIEAVFTHELGHHVHHHIWRGLAFQMSLSFFGFWVAARVLAALAPRFELRGIADVAGLPLLLLTATVVGLVLLPLSNAFSRAMERQADDYAFAQLGSADPLIRGLERLAAQNLAERQPPRWKEILFYSHPSIATRVARGRAWEQQHPQPAAS